MGQPDGPSRGTAEGVPPEPARQRAADHGPAGGTAGSQPDTGAPAAHQAPAQVRDEVDDLIAGWQSERPDLDVAPLQVLSRVSRLARHADRARRAAFGAHGLELWEFDVLSALRRQGPSYRLSPGALLRTTLVTSGTMTNRIDRLERAGLVRRDPDPQDKRGVLVTLTAAGRARVDAALADLLAAEQALLAVLPAESRHTLAGLLRTVLAPLDAPAPTARGG